MGSVAITSSPALHAWFTASHIAGMTPWVMRMSSPFASRPFLLVTFFAMASMVGSSKL